MAVDEISANELIRRYEKSRAYVIDGLVRQQEVFNLVGSTKMGKSWLGYSLLLSVVTGTPWLGKYRTERAKCLLVDNELHRETLSARIQLVASAMGLKPEDYGESLRFWTLRGQMQTLKELKADFEAAKGYGLILLDSAYRFAEEGSNENDNNSATLRYNLIDTIAEATGAAIGLVGHSSKGMQGAKRATDIISGAGAQSRAVDGHIVILEHRTPQHAVLEAVVRSFAPTDPIVLKWEAPLWKVVEGGDAGMVATSRTSLRKGLSDEINLKKLRELLPEGASMTMDQLRTSTGWTREILTRLLGFLTNSGEIRREGKRPVKWIGL